MNFFLSNFFLKSAKALYIWILGLSIGAVFATGAFSASVLFNAKDLGVNLSKFEAGILMSEIFSRLSIVLLVVAGIIVFYEILYFRLSSSSRIQRSILFLSGGISVICICLFSLYYAPYIIKAQKLGEAATTTSDFASMHSQSELVFQILFFALTINLIYRILKD